MAGSLVCDGEVSVSGGAPVCSGTWTLVQVQTPFDPSTLDLASCAQAFGFGFITIAPVLLAIAGARALIHFLKGA